MLSIDCVCHCRRLSRKHLTSGWSTVSERNGVKKISILALCLSLSSPFLGGYNVFFFYFVGSLIFRRILSTADRSSSGGAFSHRLWLSRLLAEGSAIELKQGNDGNSFGAITGRLTAEPQPVLGRCLTPSGPF